MLAALEPQIFRQIVVVLYKKIILDGCRYATITFHESRQHA